MIYVGRLEEPALATQIVRELWEHLVDDSDLRAEDYEAAFSDVSRWYVSIEDDKVVGVYWCHQKNAVTWQIHTHVRQEFWGSGKSLPHAKKMLAFIFEDTGAHKIVAEIPEASPQVLEYAQAVGFELEGRNRESFLKNGKLYDQLHLGIING